MDRVEAKAAEIGAARQAEIDRIIKMLDRAAGMIRVAHGALKNLDMHAEASAALRAADGTTDVGTRLEAMQ